MEETGHTDIAEPLALAIRHAVEAGKLRTYVREHGIDGLAGFVRLADRHSRASAAALEATAGAGGLEIADARLTASFYRGAQGER
jgi:hypothetical protein